MSIPTSRRAMLAGAATLSAASAVNLAAITATRAAEPDAHAALARAEQVIDALRTRAVCKGWKLDEEAAERALQYFRGIAAGSPDDDQEWHRVLAFFYDHGQSADWIDRGDINPMICGAARHSRRAATLAIVDDPIFAAIERHKLANAEFSRVLSVEPEPDERQEDEAGHAERIACNAMLTTAPTTLPGMLALFQYLEADGNLLDAGMYDALIGTLAVATAGMIAGTTASPAGALPARQQTAQTDAALIEMEHQLARYDRQIETAATFHSAEWGEEMDRLCKERNKLAIRIFDTRAVGLTGLAVQARVYGVERKLNQTNGEDESEGGLEDSKFCNTLAQGILRLAAG